MPNWLKAKIKINYLKEKLTIKNRVSLLLVLSLVIVGLVLTVYPVSALTSVTGDGTIGWLVDGILTAVSWLMLALARIAIALSVFFLKFFIELAGYNGYIDAPTVIVGWVMIRDVANMFFVVVLLAIAIGTILGIEAYEWKKTLVKFVLAAVFINFSKMICGLIIDIAHILTTTFINAIAAAAGGNLISMFKLDAIYKMVGANNFEKESISIEVLIATITSSFFAVWVCLTIGAYTIVMLARVVVLWALIILSPLAFIMQVIPQTQGYAKQWWEKFGKQVMVAPVMVFFLWLAFATLGNGDINSHLKQYTIPGGGVSNTNEQVFSSTQGQLLAGNEINKVSISEVSTWENMASLLVAIAFLSIGIGVVQQMGVVGGGLIQSAQNFAKKAITIASGYALGRSIAGKAWGHAKKQGKGFLMQMPGGGETWKRGFKKFDMMRKYNPILAHIPIFGKHRELFNKKMWARVEKTDKGLETAALKDMTTRKDPLISRLGQLPGNLVSQGAGKAISALGGDKLMEYFGIQHWAKTGAFGIDAATERRNRMERVEGVASNTSAIRKNLRIEQNETKSAQRGIAVSVKFENAGIDQWINKTGKDSDTYLAGLRITTPESDDKFEALVRKGLESENKARPDDEKWTDPQISQMTNKIRFGGKDTEQWKSYVRQNVMDVEGNKEVFAGSDEAKAMIEKQKKIRKEGTTLPGTGFWGSVLSLVEFTSDEGRADKTMAAALFQKPLLEKLKKQKEAMESRGLSVALDSAQARDPKFFDQWAVASEEAKMGKDKQAGLLAGVETEHRLSAERKLKAAKEADLAQALARKRFSSEDLAEARANDKAETAETGIATTRNFDRLMTDRAGNENAQRVIDEDPVVKALYFESLKTTREAEAAAAKSKAMGALGMTGVGKELLEELAEAELGKKIGDDMVKSIKDANLRDEFKQAKSAFDSINAKQADGVTDVLTPQQKKDQMDALINGVKSKGEGQPAIPGNNFAKAIYWMEESAAASKEAESAKVKATEAQAEVRNRVLDQQLEEATGPLTGEIKALEEKKKKDDAELARLSTIVGAMVAPIKKEKDEAWKKREAAADAEIASREATRIGMTRDVGETDEEWDARQKKEDDEIAGLKAERAGMTQEKGETQEEFDKKKKSALEDEAKKRREIVRTDTKLRELSRKKTEIEKESVKKGGGIEPTARMRVGSAELDSQNAEKLLGTLKRNSLRYRWAADTLNGQEHDIRTNEMSLDALRGLKKELDESDEMISMGKEEVVRIERGTGTDEEKKKAKEAALEYVKVLEKDKENKIEMFQKMNKGVELPKPDKTGKIDFDPLINGGKAEHKRLTSKMDQFIDEDTYGGAAWYEKYSKQIEAQGAAGQARAMASFMMSTDAGQQIASNTIQAKIVQSSGEEAVKQMENKGLEKVLKEELGKLSEAIRAGEDKMLDLSYDSPIVKALLAKARGEQTEDMKNIAMADLSSNIKGQYVDLENRNFTTPPTERLKYWEKNKGELQQLDETGRGLALAKSVAKMAFNGKTGKITNATQLNEMITALVACNGDGNVDDAFSSLANMVNRWDKYKALNDAKNSAKTQDEKNAIEAKIRKRFSADEIHNFSDVKNGIMLDATKDLVLKHGWVKQEFDAAGTDEVLEDDIEGAKEQYASDKKISRGEVDKLYDEDRNVAAKIKGEAIRNHSIKQVESDTSLSNDEKTAAKDRINARTNGELLIDSEGKAITEAEYIDDAIKELAYEQVVQPGMQITEEIGRENGWDARRMTSEKFKERKRLLSSGEYQKFVASIDRDEYKPIFRQASQESLSTEWVSKFGKQRFVDSSDSGSTARLQTYVLTGGDDKFTDTHFAINDRMEKTGDDFTTAHNAFFADLKTKIKAELGNKKDKVSIRMAQKKAQAAMGLAGKNLIDTFKYTKKVVDGKEVEEGEMIEDMVGQFNKKLDEYQNVFQNVSEKFKTDGINIGHYQLGGNIYLDETTGKYRAMTRKEHVAIMGGTMVKRNGLRANPQGVGEYNNSTGYMYRLNSDMMDRARLFKVTSAIEMKDAAMDRTRRTMLGLHKEKQGQQENGYGLLSESYEHIAEAGDGDYLVGAVDQLVKIHSVMAASGGNTVALLAQNEYGITDRYQAEAGMLKSKFAGLEKFVRNNAALSKKLGIKASDLTFDTVEQYAKKIHSFLENKGVQQEALGRLNKSIAQAMERGNIQLQRTLEMKKAEFEKGFGDKALAALKEAEDKAREKALSATGSRRMTSENMAANEETGDA